MNLNLDELKKDHRTSYLAEMLERISRQEAEVRQMLESDESLHDLAGEELKAIQAERQGVEKQIEDILAKDKEEESRLGGTNEIVLEVRAGAGGDEASLLLGSLLICMKNLRKKGDGSGRPTMNRRVI